MALFSARIKILEGQVASLTTERDEAAASVLELTAANAECAQRFDADQLLLGTLRTERDDFKLKLDKATVDIQAEKDGREAAISSEVTTRLAASGVVEPIRRNPAAAAVEGTTMKRADFDKLQPFAQAEFCRKGGRILD